MMLAASLCHQLAWVGSAGEVPRGGFAKREIPSSYFLGERAVSCRKPVDFSAVGRAADATLGIAERAWHVNRQGRASRTCAARRGTPPLRVGSGAKPPPL